MKVLSSLLGILAVLPVALTARGNPIPVGASVEIDSERLTVSVKDGHADVSGTFTFRSVAYRRAAIEARMPNTGRGKANEGQLTIPLWIPANAEGGAKQLLKLVPDGGRLMDEALARAVDEAFALKVTAGSFSLKPAYVGALAPRPWWKANRQDRGLARRGYHCLLFFVVLPEHATANGKPITISYRQPMRATRSAAEFIYVPFLPTGSAAPRHECTMVLTNDGSRSMSLGGATIPPGHTATLPLSDGEEVTVWRK